MATHLKQPLYSPLSGFWVIKMLCKRQQPTRPSCFSDSQLERHSWLDVPTPERYALFLLSWLLIGRTILNI